MMGSMIKDVINFLQLLILVLLGFAGAPTTLSLRTTYYVLRTWYFVVLAYSLTRLPAYSLTHLLTYSLTHLLTYSLPTYQGALTTLFASDQTYKELDPGSEGMCPNLMGPASSFGSVRTGPSPHLAPDPLTRAWSWSWSWSWSWRVAVLSLEPAP